LALWCRRYDSSTQTWGSWERLGGILVSGPTAAYVGEGKFQVFAVGVENTLWQKIYDESAGGWSDWLPVPGSGVTFTSDPEAVSARVGYSPPQYHVHLFIRGADNALWHKWWDGSSWRP
jgi:hypothetical protein